MYIQDSVSLVEIPKSGKVRAVLSKKNFSRLPDWCSLVKDVVTDIESIVNKSETGDKTSLYISFDVEFRTICQRCLDKMSKKITFSVSGEKKTAQDKDFYFSREEIFDIENTYCKNSQLDLLRLCEDELILALPMVPKHEFDCGQPRYREFREKIGSPSPFALLLKNKDKN